MSDTPKAPLTTTTSIWPAASVIGIALVVLVVFMGINLVAGKGVATTTTVPVVVGGVNPASVTQDSSVLGYCEHYSEIPSNIVSGFILPEGSVTNGLGNVPNAGAGEFDCRQPVRTNGHTSSEVLAFYADQLAARGWNLFSKGASNGAPQYLFQKAGSDTFYWVMGVTVTKRGANFTNWTFRIYQNSSTI